MAALAPSRWAAALTARRLAPRAPPRACRGVGITGSEIRPGDLLEMDGGLWRVTWGQVSRTAQGRAYMQCEVRHLTEGTKKDLRFRSDEPVERADLEPGRKVQVLYSDGASVHVMDQTTCEQAEIPLAALGEQAQYLQDGMFLHVEMFKGAPAVINFPMRVTLTVTQVEEASGSAFLENKMRVRVPKHVKVGDKAVVDTRNGEYMGKE
jgi:elongation factor P